METAKRWGLLIKVSQTLPSAHPHVVLDGNASGLQGMRELKDSSYMCGKLGLVPTHHMISNPKERNGKKATERRETQFSHRDSSTFRVVSYLKHHA